MPLRHHDQQSVVYHHVRRSEAFCFPYLFPECFPVLFPLFLLCECPDLHTPWPVQRKKEVLLTSPCLKQAYVLQGTFLPQSTDLSELGNFCLIRKNKTGFDSPETSCVSSEFNTLWAGESGFGLWSRQRYVNQYAWCSAAVILSCFCFFF